MWHRGERGVSLASNFERVLYYASIWGDQAAHSLFDTSLASSIPRPQRKTRKVDRAAIQLDTGERRCEEGKDEILGTLAASITTREEVDVVLIAIVPKEAN